jgi:hypothetical protein
MKNTQDALFPPSLDAATAAWKAARHRFQNEGGREQRDAYMNATDELGQAISRWQAEHPAVAEQFGFWFLSHQELWSVQGADGASRL